MYPRAGNFSSIIKEHPYLNMKIVVANWKMNPPTLKRAKRLLSHLENVCGRIKNLKIVICPPFVYLPIFSQSNLILGAQNVFWEMKGAFTGEISPPMLKSLKCKYVILGHSERRRLGEDYSMIRKKIISSVRAGLRPIVCIGEEKEGENVIKIIKKELLSLLNGIPPKFLLAYEPVWAIGSKRPCPPQRAKRALFFLKKYYPKTRILYGGSVSSSNASEYIKVGFDGLLIGSASLNIKEFTKILLALTA